MPPNEHDEHGPAITDTSETNSSDPRATDHPTGSEQAAENAANESPSCDVLADSCECMAHRHSSGSPHDCPAEFSGLIRPATTPSMSSRCRTSSGLG